MDVLNGKVQGTSKLAGSMPNLSYIGVPIKPATPDLTSQVAQVLDFKPQAIMFSGQGADCWNLVAGLTRAGWTPDEIPLVMSGSCIDFDKMKEAGDAAKGVTFVGAGGTLLNDPATIASEYGKFEASTYQTKAKQYGLAADQINKGFATQGFGSMLLLWQLATQYQGGQITSDDITKAFGQTDGVHSFGSTPLSCATAMAPYVAVCNSQVAASTWDGSALQTVVPLFSGVDLVAGTPIKSGPS